MDQEQQVDRVLQEVPPPEAVDSRQPPQTVLHPHTDPRSIALGVLAALAVLAVLRWASAFFVPVMLGFVFFYALSPLVDAMERVRVPRAAGAAVLLSAVLGGIGLLAWSLTDDANALINKLPDAAERLADVVRNRSDAEATPLETVQEAAAKLERAATEAEAKVPPPAPGVQRVVVEEPRFNITDHLWTGTIGLVGVLGQVVIVSFLTYFLLVSGDTFRRKLVKIAGPTLTEKKLTVQALDEINLQIQRYLLVQLLASALVGVATAVAFALLGMEYAAVWGVAAAVLNLVPYVGAIMVTAGAALVAFMQFGELEPALTVTVVSLVINTLEGYLLVPWLTSRANSMNPVAVFIGVLAWGWLWGVWGLLLGIPIMMVIKAVCDRVEELKPVGELLGTRD
ncbi:AI-2E family transporter [Ramlibacter rhizophilus]|uniref:AI-2E family transporter n=1 Tax=Ramlibacter rhizophilus TaxID=1781167 RepID=A0A4Z0BDX6_9BURK|nr:AI-2E family transporter [Ramlibacter rhizophilus]TFY96527.1 AI-2E family transporter [Ramlibacter rhizophilus]